MSIDLKKRLECMRAGEDGQFVFAHASGENDEAARKENRILETVHPTHCQGTIHSSLEEI